jgi:tetratricopeptide (TPR) repeat protein
MIMGCGGGGDGGGGPTDTAESLTAEGWALFEQGQYQDALNKFGQATTHDATYADAYNGLGWSNAELDLLSEALTGFSNCIAHGMDTADPHAGRAAVRRDHNNNYSGAISSALTALSKDRRYEFSHDTSYDWKDLMLILAHSYFAADDLSSANAWIDSLPGGNPQDPDSAADIAAEIERLTDVYGG